MRHLLSFIVRKKSVCVFFAGLTFVVSCSAKSDTIGGGIIRGNFVYCDTPYNGKILVSLVSDRFGVITQYADDDGAFQFEDVWAGTYTLSFVSNDVEFSPSGYSFTFDGATWTAKDIAVIKSWMRVDGTSYPSEYLSSILQTDDFGYIAVGHQGDYQSYKALVRKYDRDGTVVWERTLDDSDACFDLKSIVRTSSGYVATGETAVLNGRSSILTTDVFQDTGIVSGAIGVKKRYSAAGSHYYASTASSSTVFSDGRLFSSGKTTDQTSGLYDYFLFSQAEDGSDSATFVDTDAQDGKTEFVSVAVRGQNLFSFGNKAAVENDGTVTDRQIPVLYIMDRSPLQITNTYSYPLDGIASTVARCIAVDSGSNVFLGVGCKQDEYDPEKGMVIKIGARSPSTILWNVYPNGSEGRIYDIIPDGEGGIVGVGGVNSEDVGVSVTAVFRIGSDGNLRWTRTFEGCRTSEEFGCSIRRTKDDGFVVCGTMSSARGHKGDFLILKLNPNGEIYGKN